MKSENTLHTAIRQEAGHEQVSLGGAASVDDPLNAGLPMRSSSKAPPHGADHTQSLALALDLAIAKPTCVDGDDDSST